MLFRSVSVPASHAADAIYEAADAGIRLIVCITEHIPVADMMRLYQYLRNKRTRLVGPNCPGLLTPAQCKVGILPAAIGTPGSVGVVSRSGTLTYEVGYSLTQRGIGQSTFVGIGGDPILGTNFVEVLAMFEQDPDTEQVVLLGEIGGRSEIDAADFVKSSMTKPITAFIAGESAPAGRRMGHAGAIIEGVEGTAMEKIAALEAAGVRVARNPDEIPDLVLSWRA